MKAAINAGIWLGLILVAGIIGVGVVAQSILPLYPITASITVKNSVTGQPISGAFVSAYLFGNLLGSGTTNQNGVALVNCNSNIAITFTVIASGYLDKTEVLTLNAAASATILMTPGGGPTYTIIRVYTVTVENYAVRDVKIQGGVSPGLTNAEAYADIPCSGSSVSLTLDGSVAMVHRSINWELMTFQPVSVTLQVVNGAVYTVFVPAGTVLSGKPTINTNSFLNWDMIVAFLNDIFLNGSLIPGVPNWILVAFALILILGR